VSRTTFNRHPQSNAKRLSESLNRDELMAQGICIACIQAKSQEENGKWCVNCAGALGIADGKAFQGYREELQRMWRNKA
jgi:hypothetical protein